MAKIAAVRWCYTTSGKHVYSVSVPLYIAQQTDANGEPLIGGGPVTDDSIGPIPKALRPRYVTVRNPKTGKERQVTVFSEKAPLWGGHGWHQKTIELIEKDGSTATYEMLRTTNEAHRSHAWAPPPGFSGRFTGWRYTTDQGFSYVLRIERYVVEQTDSDGRPLVGGQPVSGTSGFPSGVEPRTVTLYCADNGKVRKVIVFSTDAPLWTGTASTIQFKEGDSGFATYRVRKRTDEHWSRRLPGSKTSDTTAGRSQDVDDGFDSSIEAAFWEVWQRQTRTRLVPQHLLAGRYRTDFAHLPSKTAIELDGYYYHSDPERFRRDRQRDRELAELGWQVVRFAGEEVVENVERCVEQAARLVQSRQGDRDRASGDGLGDAR